MLQVCAISYANHGSVQESERSSRFCLKSLDDAAETDTMAVTVSVFLRESDL